MYSTNINGEIVEFGTSGLLYRSNKLMYDRSTLTLWRQFTGEPVVGAMADSGLRLEALPVVVTTWGDWVARHPDTSVLDIETGIYRAEDYAPEGEFGSVYFGYRQSPTTMFPVWVQSDLVDTKVEVVGVVVNGNPKAYLLDAIKEERVINDTLADQGIVVIGTDTEQGGTRVYKRGDNTFSLPEGGTDDERLRNVVDELGRTWVVEEDGLVLESDSEERLERIPAFNAFWFGWFASYPKTATYGADS